MIRSRYLCIVTVLVTFCSLTACEHSTEVRALNGDFVYHTTDKDVGKNLFGKPDLTVLSEARIVLNGVPGVLRKIDNKYRLTFEGKDTEVFRIIKSGNQEGSSIWFWLEFTESGNCVIYSDTGANVFVKYQRPKQQM